jgi:hypothetical protein
VGRLVLSGGRQPTLEEFVASEMLKLLKSERGRKAVS